MKRPLLINLLFIRAPYLFRFLHIPRRSLHLALFLFLTLSSSAFSQDLQWAVSSGDLNSDMAISVTRDIYTSVYVTGKFTGKIGFTNNAGTTFLTSAGGEDIFVVKLSHSGYFMWGVSMGGPGNDAGLALSTDHGGNVYVTGVFYGTVDFDPDTGVQNMTSAGSADIFIVQLNALEHTLNWVKTIGGPGYDAANSITSPPAGNAYLTGTYSDTVDFDTGAGVKNLISAGQSDAFVIKIDGNGNLNKAVRLGGSQDDIGTSIGVNLGDHMFVTGTFNGTADMDPGAAVHNLTSSGNRDVFVVMLDNTAKFSYAKRLGGKGDDVAGDLWTDWSGHVMITGTFDDTVSFDPGSGIPNLVTAGAEDIYVAKLDYYGDFAWVKSMGGSASDRAFSVYAQNWGDVFVTGSYNQTADFDPGISTYYLTSAGLSDIFITRLDTDGNFTWARSIGDSGIDLARSIWIDKDYVYVCGSFNGTVDFDPAAAITKKTSKGGSDVFVLKLGRGFGTGIQEVMHEQLFEIFPNPANESFTLLSSASAPVSYSMTDLWGRQLLSGETCGTETQIDISSLTAGIYFVRVEQRVMKVVKE